MAGQLKGSADLRRRLKAVRVAFKPMGRKWADTTVQLARQNVSSHNRTGKSMRSIRVRNSTQRRATVVGRFSLVFLDKGAKKHAIKARRARTLAFSIGGQTIFAKRVNHPGQRGTGFAAKAARESLRRHPLAETLIDEWNRAA